MDSLSKVQFIFGGDISTNKKRNKKNTFVNNDKRQRLKFRSKIKTTQNSHHSGFICQGGNVEREWGGGGVGGGGEQNMEKKTKNVVVSNVQCSARGIISAAWVGQRECLLVSHSAIFMKGNKTLRRRKISTDRMTAPFFMFPRMCVYVNIQIHKSVFTHTHK